MQIECPLRTRSLPWCLYGSSPSFPGPKPWTAELAAPGPRHLLRDGRTEGSQVPAHAVVLSIWKLYGKDSRDCQSQLSPSFPGWKADDHVLRGEACRRRQIHVVPMVAIWFLEQLLLAEEVQMCAHQRILHLCSFLLIHSLSCFQFCVYPTLCSGSHSIVSPLYLQISLIPAQHAKE